jgi:ketosteroid isomerase-like protein
MSQENVEIVRRLYEYWTRGDFRSGVEEAFDPNVEFGVDATVATTPAVKVRGLAEMAKVWRETLSGWGDFRVGKIDRLVEKGDQVIVFNRLQGRGRRSGAVVEQPDRAAIFTFRDQRVVRLRLTNRAGGLQAAGLSE